MESSAPKIDAVTDWREELLVELVPHAVHRLGNLLTVILGTADLLALGEDSAGRSEQLDSVVLGARRATDLVRALGVHARSNAEPPHALDLAEVFQGVEELLSPVCKAGGYEIAALQREGMTLVRSDQTGLRLLVLGLLMAQCRPGPRGERRDGRLEVRVQESGTEVELLATCSVVDGLALPLVELDPRALELARELGASVSQELEAGGSARVLRIGLARLEA